jgi:uncharacterized RDD family membrane protein YckC
VPEPDRWDEPDDETAEKEPIGRSSAIGARVDLDREPDTAPEPDPEPTGRPGPERSRGEGSPASPWRRLGAYLLDSLLLAVPTNLALDLALGSPRPELLETASTAEIADLAASAPGELLAALWPFFAIGFGIELVYFAGMESSTLQATVGKHLLDIQAADGRGQRMSLARALVRNAGKLLSALPFGLGFLLVFVTDRNQALHDKLADCLVLDEPDEGPELGPSGDPGGGWEP